MAKQPWIQYVAKVCLRDQLRRLIWVWILREAVGPVASPTLHDSAVQDAKTLGLCFLYNPNRVVRPSLFRCSQHQPPLDLSFSLEPGCQLSAFDLP